MSVGPDRYLILIDGPGDRMIDRDELVAQVTAATGLKAQCLGAGADYHLEHERFPEPHMRDQPPLAANATVGGAFLETQALGLMPALYMRFDGPEFSTEFALIGDERSHAYRQVGNAFPPPVARALGQRIAQAILAASRYLARERIGMFLTVEHHEPNAA